MGLKQGSANFFYKNPDSKNFTFVGHNISIATTQLCYCKVKAATDKWASEHACITKKKKTKKQKNKQKNPPKPQLYLQKQGAVHIVPTGHILFRSLICMMQSQN